MSKTKQDRGNSTSIPQWQSNRMKTLISERWYEVWEIVEAREKDKKPNWDESSN